MVARSRTKPPEYSPRTPVVIRVVVAITPTWANSDMQLDDSKPQLETERREALRRR